MKMAAVNMLSQPWLPTPSLYASGSTNKSNANNKLHSYRNSVAASPYEPNRSNSPSKSGFFLQAVDVPGCKTIPCITKILPAVNVERVHCILCFLRSLQKFLLCRTFLNLYAQIGFSAPQGCGKTTLVFSLDYLFKVMGRKSASISIDDFYLAAEGQLRRTAGSHDLPFSVETLSDLTEFSKEGMKMKLCRYDKSAYNGKGDRADPSMWPEVEGPLTAVLFEGWMLGFKPLPEEVVKAVHPQLGTVNKNLEAYYAWYKFIKAWIIIKIKDPSCVYQWRLQAKIAMREAGKPEMSDDEVKDIVSRYLSEYNAYLPTLYSEGPEGSDPRRLILVEIDEGRNPIFSTY